MMRRASHSSRSLWLAPILALATSSVEAHAAAGADPIHLPAVHLADGVPPPAIDGKVDDDAWLQIEPYSSFTQTDPIEGAPASERTEVRVLIDKATLYIGVICFDSEPDKIVVNQSRRDADLTETDAIILVLDTFNDNQNAFVFGTNPLGIEYDGQVSGRARRAAPPPTCSPGRAGRSGAASDRSTRTGMATGV